MAINEAKIVCIQPNPTEEIQVTEQILKLGADLDIFT